MSIALDRINSAFNALDIRNLMATQRWREIANTGDRTYRSQIEKHFGVTLPQMLENNCVYIDGWKGSVAINEVVNTNLQSSADDNSPKATIEGKGVGDIDGHEFDFDVKEHGIIMAIGLCPTAPPIACADIEVCFFKQAIFFAISPYVVTSP